MGPAAQVLALLDSDGEEARVVGGAVRDALLGGVPREIDIATTALPDAVMRRARAAGLKTAPTGIAHGTVTVIAGGTPFEVTTLRQDVETFGRKAAVRFGRDWQADAERRDFTFNALSATRDGVVYDPVGGAADLAAGRVRFIGDPAERIREDYLRILRYFRFHASHGRGAPDAAALAAVVAEREGLALLSRERVRMELMKLLAAANAAPALALMTEHGILVPLIAGVPVAPQVGRMGRLESALELPADPLRRLAALALHAAEDADRLRTRLRLANSEQERLRVMADVWWRVAPSAEDSNVSERDAGGKPVPTFPHPALAARALLYRLGGEKYLDAVLLGWVRACADPADAAWHQLASLPARWNAPRFPLRAAEFIARGLDPGPTLGRALELAAAAWIAADFPTGPDALDAIAETALRQAQSG